MAEVISKGRSPFEVSIQKNKCKSCELCIIYCPTQHLKLSREFNTKGVVYPETKKGTLCIGCGFCFIICPEVCIEVHKKSQGIGEK